MVQSLIIEEWNANGLSNYVHEITIFLQMSKVDILIVSWSHATTRTTIKILNYVTYYTNYFDGGAHAGSAIIFKTIIKHYVMKPYGIEKIQSAMIKVENLNWPITVAAICMRIKTNNTENKIISIHYQPTN